MAGVVWIAATAGAAAVEPAPGVNLTVTIGDASTLIRLETLIEGEPLTSACEEFLARLFAELDRDGDGAINAREAERAPTGEWLRTLARGDFVNVSERPLASVGVFSKSETIAKEVFIDAYRAWGSLGGDVRVAPPVQRDDRVNRVLFKALTGNDAGPLTADSFRSACETLRRFDADDDERISEAELLVESRDVGEPTDRKISLTSEPSIGDASSHLAITASFVTGRPLPEVAVSTKAPGVRDVAVVGAAGLGAGPFLSAKQELHQQFETDDADGDGALNAVERRASPIGATWEALTASADRDDDDRLTVVERNRWLDLFDAAAALRIEAVPVDEGRLLLDRLDADGDARLTLRELSNGWTQVAAWDADRDGTLTWSEVPHRVTVVLSRGPAASKPGRRLIAPVVATRRGPDWIQRMDRNGDGDVSRREFLGPIEVFRKLDSDADGLLNDVEATAAG